MSSTSVPSVSAAHSRQPGTPPQPIWMIEIRPAEGCPNRLAAEIAENARYLALPDSFQIDAGWGFLIQTGIPPSELSGLAEDLLVDGVVETFQLTPVSEPALPALANAESIYVLPLPGVTDSRAETAMATLRSLGWDVEAVRTFRRFSIVGLDANQRQTLIEKLLCNESIEQAVAGSLELTDLALGQSYVLEQRSVAILDADGPQLEKISADWQLSLTRIEMETIQEYFRRLDRDPTDIELETIAQTWSEHCSHKTLAGRIRYRDERGERQFENMLKETIFAATQQIRRDLGDEDWCVSVFKDNAGIVRFDDEFNVAFKVETHNRPSALEPYGGANTGIGGVIRDTLGTGMGAHPICNTNVFCFAPPDTPYGELPPGVMHPRLIMQGVVAGVRDYGNRMGIPTVNGALYFDPRYIGNPLVFCGNVGRIPRDHSFKQPQPNDLIVSIGGRTGRDGIHGATFSSVELTEDSEVTSGGAVQIGNAITEKMLMDVMLVARDRGLFHAVTDCGAGGFSSAVGEMGEEIGAEVWLDRAPLKYEGLSHTEIWISEAQERMVFAVPEDKWPEFQTLCASESVEATVIGQFKPTGRLELKYGEQTVGSLEMAFLHDGRPAIVREAIYQPVASSPIPAQSLAASDQDWNRDLLQILGSLNVASKEWVIRQYDHEVQGGSVLKPLVGIENDGPGDAAVLRPVLRSYRGIAVACGMNPRFGDLDPYQMAASAIDEAVRNCVAVGADPDRIAILDNFCWGYTDRPETLGTLVRAALGCQETAVALGTPFISGKDSLNNEFSFSRDGERQTISIPSTLLISALGQVNDVRRCVSMDLKSPGNRIYQVGWTGDHLGGSHWCLVREQSGGAVPTVNPQRARELFGKMHRAIEAGWIRAAHDLSEGGLAVAIAEMAFAGGCGARLDLSGLLREAGVAPTPLIDLFSESNTRFLIEVPPHCTSDVEAEFGECLSASLGEVTAESRVEIRSLGETLIDCDLATLKSAWQTPLNWD